jgi:hypothetical protein
VWERGSSEYLEITISPSLKATEQAGVEVSTASIAFIKIQLFRDKKIPHQGEGFYRAMANYTIKIS